MLADMAVQRDAARGLTERAIATLMRGERGTLEAAMAKLYATEALGKVVDAAVQIHGGMGYMREAGIETTFRDARITRIYEGTSEIQRNIIAAQLLKDAVKRESEVKGEGERWAWRGYCKTIDESRRPRERRHRRRDGARPADGDRAGRSGVERRDLLAQARELRAGGARDREARRQGARASAAT